MLAMMIVLAEMKAEEGEEKEVEELIHWDERPRRLKAGSMGNGIEPEHHMQAGESESVVENGQCYSEQAVGEVADPGSPWADAH